MSELYILMRLELASLFGFNKFRHTKDRKEKSRYRLLTVVWVFLALMVTGYVGGQTVGLCVLDLSRLVPSYLLFISAVLVLFVELFKAGATVFSSKSHDILASLPISHRSVVYSRLVVLYLQDLVLTLLIILPGMVMYGVMESPSMVTYLIALAGWVCVPIIPLVVALLLSTLITAISVRMRHRSLVGTLLSVVLVVGVLVGSLFSKDLSVEDLSGLAGQLSDLFSRIYPPAAWVGEAMTGGSAWGLLAFVLLSVGLAVLTLLVTARLFPSVVRKLRAVSAKHDYTIGNLDRSSLLRALYRREAKRYFSSTIYVTNTIIGPIMGAIMAGALFFTGLDTITGVLPSEIPVVKLLPFVIGTVFCMMTTTSSSISLEGRQFWVIKSLPIPVKPLLDAKILLNLSLMLPFYLLAEVFLFMTVRPGFVEAIWLVLIPALIMLFTVVCGISINLKLHSFDWDKEEQIVKQSGSSMLGGFLGILVTLPLVGLILVVPTAYTDGTCMAICLVLALVTAFLYKRNNRTRLEAL